MPPHGFALPAGAGAGHEGPRPAHREGYSRDLAHMRGGTMSSDDDDRAVARIAIYIKREALGGSSQTASET